MLADNPAKYDQVISVLRQSTQRDELNDRIGSVEWVYDFFARVDPSKQPAGDKDTGKLKVQHMERFSLECPTLIDITTEDKVRYRGVVWEVERIQRLPLDGLMIQIVGTDATKSYGSYD